MIPAVVPPLRDLAVLVTRPAAQATKLCAQISAWGGEAIALPAIEIEPLPASPAEEHDLIVFVSVNAVIHGSSLIRRSATTRIAAVGKATAAALKELDLIADIVPQSGFNSEALLAHPAFEASPPQRVLIVRGSGGRELMTQTFATRGCTVAMLDVYRRVAPRTDPKLLDAVEARWADTGIDMVALTSVETLSNLIALLSDHGRTLLRQTPMLVASHRILEAAEAAGMHGGGIVAAGADNASMLGALARWRMRARTLS